MCILFLEYRPEAAGNSPYVLVAANNRDELYERETAPAGYWSDYPNILAGRDLERKGTWLGVSRNGRFAVLTNRRKNYQEPPLPDKRSRGSLVVNFLTGAASCTEYCEAIEHGEYEGFNIIVGNIGSSTASCRQLVYSTNEQLDDRSPEILPAGTYGLSNHLLDSPWAKVDHGKKRFTAILQQQQAHCSKEELTSHCSKEKLTSHCSKKELTSQLLELMADTTCYHPDPNVTDTRHTEEWMKAFSSVFVAYPEMRYGTRTSTVVLIDRQGEVMFTERTMIQPVDPYNPQWTTTTFSFTIK